MRNGPLQGIPKQYTHTSTHPQRDSQKKPQTNKNQNNPNITGNKCDSRIPLQARTHTYTHARTLVQNSKFALNY